IEGGFHIDHWITGDDTVLQRLSNAILNRFDVFFWHCTADNSVDKLKALAALIRLNTHPDITILSATTCLTYMLTLCLSILRNRLAVGHLRTTNISIYLEFSE